MQTYLVHMRHPLRLMGAIGFGAWWSFQLVAAGIFVALVLPILVALTALLGLTVSGLVESPLPQGVLYASALTILAGAMVYACLLAAGSARRGLGLARYAVLGPVHWILASISGWLGLYQLCTRPFLWEKT